MLGRSAKPDLGKLAAVTTRIRRHVLGHGRHVGSGHLGGPLSVADMLAVLYGHELRIDPARPRWEDRDRCAR